MTQEQAVRGRPRVAAALVGGLLLVLTAVDPSLAALARESIDNSNGSVPVWVSAAFGLVGFVVAWRKPRNPIGWILLAVAAFFALAQDASFYVVASYRLRHGDLPFSWVALLAQPGWAPGIVLGGLAVLLFPDGRLPSPRWRWMLWIYLGVSAAWAAGTLVVTVGAIARHQTRVDSGGNLLYLDHATGWTVWWGWLNDVFFPALALGWLISLGVQVAAFRRASGERREQLKWLLAGPVVTVVLLLASAIPSGGIAAVSDVQHVLGSAVWLMAIPVTMGVAIMRYRLYDIDRIVSRTLGYAIVTGLLIGVYAGLVLLATQVLRFSSPVAVAAATLAAAALFSPVRRRVQHVVDRRFNRARYDADQTVAAFATSLKDAVDLDTVRADLLGVVDRSLEPERVFVWVRPP